MLAKYSFALSTDKTLDVHTELGYRLYAALLEQLPPEFGDAVHQDGATPTSQYLSREGRALVWNVSLLGPQAQRYGALLEWLDRIRLDTPACELQLQLRSIQTAASVEQLLEQAEGIRRFDLVFRSPTAFRSKGKYVNLPTQRLLVQNLIKKWNAVIPECPIEDVDGEGMDALAEGLTWERFSLESAGYRLKGAVIPGFTGTATVCSRLPDFQGQLLSALLLFASYSGIGIKTALGMGGVDVAASKHHRA